MSTRFEALDGLRGISAVMVIFYHFGLDLFDTTGLFEGNFFIHTSYAFVDFFFVLSGFVITHTYILKIHSWADFKDYLVKRFARLYPLLFISVLAFLFIKVYALYFTQFQFDTANYGAKNLLLETIEPLTFLNSVPLISSDAGMNPVSWSISAEMISYVIFGLITLLGPTKVRPVILLWVLGCVVFIVFNQRYLYTGEWGAIRAGLNFGLGALIYLNKDRFKLKGSFSEFLFVFLLVLGFYAIYNSKNELSNLILPLLFSLGVLVYSQEKGLISKFLKKPTIQFLGKISYSVYLIHFIILWMSYQLINMFALQPSHKYEALIWLIIILTVTIATSAFTYRFIEVNWGKKIKSWLIAE